MARVVWPVLVFHLLPGCWLSRQGDVGLAFTPTIHEVYEVRGLIQSAGILPVLISGARVTALDGESVLDRATTNSRGEFAVNGFRTEDAPPELLEKLPIEGTEMSSVLALEGGTASPMVVKHNLGAIQRHKHWQAQLHVEAAGYQALRLKVELPRRLDERLTVQLQPRE